MRQHHQVHGNGGRLPSTGARRYRAAMVVTLHSGDWIVSAKARSTSLSPDRDTVFAFDLEGRPISWYDAGRIHKRSLASDVHVRAREGAKRRRFVLDPAAARAAFGALLERVAEVPRAGLSPEVRGRLADILAWTPERLLAERARFDAAYRPVSILPPDQYLAIVVQATFGCTWNRCTFCNFYQDRPFRARPLGEIERHLARVATLLGRAASLRRRLFLADGNALILANARLRPVISATKRIFPGRPLYGFVDVFTGERKPVEDWVELRELGLERVYLGLETGHDPLLAWMNKPGSANAAAEFVGTLKAAGLRVSVIFMVGAGGERFAGAHVRDTLALAARLPLGAGDLVYLSPFREHPDSPYARRARDEGIAPLDGEGAASQHRVLRDGIRSALPAAQVAAYDIREFVY